MVDYVRDRKGSRDVLLKFWDPLRISETGKARNFKFGMRCWKWPTATLTVTSVFTRWPIYLSLRLRSSGLISARISNTTCHYLSRYTRE